MANLPTKESAEGRSHIRIHTPLIDLTTAQIIREGVPLGVNYSLTSTCCDPGDDGNEYSDAQACSDTLELIL